MDDDEKKDESRETTNNLLRLILGLLIVLSFFAYKEYNKHEYGYIANERSTPIPDADFGELFYYMFNK